MLPKFAANSAAMHAGNPSDGVPVEKELRMLPRMPVLIAGGGIGGLSAAIALGRRGHATKVIERADAFAPIGYGIQLGPNAFHMFEKLGIAEEVLRYSSLPDDVLVFDALTGARLMRIPLGAAVRERYGQPYAVIHRADFHEVLLGVCAKLDLVELQAGCALTSFEEHEDHVEVRTSSGNTVAALALIGADGIHSSVRSQLFGKWKEESLGYAAFRRVAPMHEIPAHLAPNSVVCWCGPGFHLVHYPLRGGKLFNMVAVTQYEASDEASAIPARLLEAFSKACDAVRTLVGHVDLTRHWPIRDITPPSEWSRGRVSLLGDAAHAMVQAMAQGACQAIEDGVWLAECIERTRGDHARAFELLCQERLLRAARAHYMSRYMWEMIHVGGGLAALRKEILGRVSDTEWLERLVWLYENPFNGAGTGATSYYAPVLESR